MLNAKQLLRKIVIRIRGEYDIDTLVKKGLKVGENFNSEWGVIIDPPHCWLITIGDNVTLASKVYVLAHDASTKKLLGYTKIGKVTIGNDVFIGAGSTILPNVNIGNNVIVGAGSVVTKDIPNNSVAVGNPARVIGTIDDLLNKNREEMQFRPIFDEAWTERGNITNAQKTLMIERLRDGFGYVK